MEPVTWLLSSGDAAEGFVGLAEQPARTVAEAAAITNAREKRFMGVPIGHAASAAQARCA
ncbi:hypothetical protein GCM10009862_23370 [Microbacterium binotii]|uniref:Uncharacterized protein n=1 Tax=Microbacterium binotii TaxID=462710 RepID=A0ABP6BRZ6_9MICO